MNIYSKAYADIYYILGCLDDEYKKKIPKKLIDFFRDNAEPYYLSDIDITKPLIEQNISQETEQLICLLNLNYWCDQNEKQELLKKYELNEQEIEAQLQNKYDIKFNKIFQIEDVKAIAIIEKENIFSKILKLLKRIMSKKK